MSRLKFDITGVKSGMLTAVKECGKSPKGETLWLCKCDCGNEAVVTVSQIRGKHTISCGCSKRSKNDFIVHGDFAEIILTSGNATIVDSDKVVDLVNMCRWTENSRGYVVGQVCRKQVKLHRIITQCDRNQVVDHINHNTLDNRMQNLRVCSTSQNGMNRKLNSNNNSGKSGVSYIKKERKWKAALRINGKYIYGGSFDDYNDAVLARKKLEAKYYGEYAYGSKK